MHVFQASYASDVTRVAVPRLHAIKKKPNIYRPASVFGARQQTLPLVFVTVTRMTSHQETTPPISIPLDTIAQPSPLAADRDLQVPREPPEAPEAPEASEAPEAPEAPEASDAPEAPVAPEAPDATTPNTTATFEDIDLEAPPAYSKDSPPPYQPRRMRGRGLIIFVSSLVVMGAILIGVLAISVGRDRREHGKS